ncbi:PilX-like prepilin protein [Modicisalibacter xianhensis]|uniref:PilX-like prepilin protein n=1 Tax=Modicisalibacter xianhensis TaxID=442341 RepID=A0A4R8G9B6_9GAMM|nr:polymer-forming cytoskeletal protein [Halomonas xianhensis]TDX32092.1 PilX-like prepilin protein [Halomonas xianhensis]
MAHTPGSDGCSGQRRHQRGAALLVALVLLSVMLMLGLSSMSNSAIEERMAANQRAHVLAYNEAEAGAGGLFRSLQHGEALGGGTPPRKLLDVLQAIDSATMPVLTDCASTQQQKRNALESARETLAEKLGEDQAGSWQAGINAHGESAWELVPYPDVVLSLDEAACEESGNAPSPYLPLANNEAAVWVVSQGRYGQEGAWAQRSVRTLVRLAAAEAGSAVNGLMTCEGVSVLGSGIIDSYDSAEGAYGGKNQRKGNVLVSSQVHQDPSDPRFDPLDGSYREEQAAVYLQGSSPIYGRVESAGGVAMTGSAEIHGDTVANASVYIKGGGAHLYGDVDAVSTVVLASSGNVHGNVRTNDRIVTQNWSAWIGGDATTSEFVSRRTPQDQVGGTLSLRPGGAGVDAVASVATPSECDSLGFGEASTDPVLLLDAAGLVSGGPLDVANGNKDYRLDAAGFHRLDSGGRAETRLGQAPVTVELADGRESLAVKFGDFSLGGSNTITVGSPGSPVDMVLYIDGSTDLGGGSRFVISEGSTLQMVTTGAFNLGSGLVLGDGKPSKTVDGKVVPIFSLYSSHDDGDAANGVIIGGASAFYGQIVAPFSTMDVTGSGGFFGAANVGSAVIRGAGGFHFDERFLDLRIAPPGGAGKAVRPYLEAWGESF